MLSLWYSLNVVVSVLLQFPEKVYLQVADLRGQHGELSAEADSTREKLSRQLQEKQEEIQQVLFCHN